MGEYPRHRSGVSGIWLMKCWNQRIIWPHVKDDEVVEPNSENTDESSCRRTLILSVFLTALLPRYDCFMHG